MVPLADDERVGLAIEAGAAARDGGGNPDAYYRSDGHEARHDGAGSLPADDAARLHMGNRYEGVDIELVAEPPARREWTPVETVSNSEAGFERMHQGSCLLVSWPLDLAAGNSQSVSAEFRVSQTRDRAAEES